MMVRDELKNGVGVVVHRPRAAAAIEVFWTGAQLPDGSARNVLEALPRLHDIRYRMVARGISAIPLQVRRVLLYAWLHSFARIDRR
jgi:hypothetical protein